MSANNETYNHDYTEIQDLQEAQIAACRQFYCEEQPQPVVDEEYLFNDCVTTEVVITNSNCAEIAEFLRSAKTWLAFKPAIVEENGVLKLIF